MDEEVVPTSIKFDEDLINACILLNNVTSNMANLEEKCVHRAYHKSLVYATIQRFNSLCLLCILLSAIEVFLAA